MLRDNAGWLLAGLVAAAVLFSAGACGGDGGASDAVSDGSISFRQATPTPPSPTEASTTPTVSTRAWGARESMRVKGIVIYLPAGSSYHSVIVDFPPGENKFHVIERGDSEVAIGMESGKIVRWDVAPEDEEEFRRLILEPLEEAGY